MWLHEGMVHINGIGQGIRPEDLGFESMSTVNRGLSTSNYHFLSLRGTFAKLSLYIWTGQGFNGEKINC